MYQSIIKLAQKHTNKKKENLNVYFYIYFYYGFDVFKL